MKHRLPTTFAAVLFILCLWPAAAWTWSDHALLTQTALRKTKLATTQVQAESLENFLAATETALIPLLEDIQRDQQNTVYYWPALPSNLSFKAGLPLSEKKAAFLKAIRVRSIYPAELYIQPISGTDYGSVTHVDVEKVVATAVENVLVARVPFINISEGQEVSALEVVSTASNEPDFGMDQRLWEGQSPDGNEYKFGKFPFGRADLDYSTQAPFHMGFFHEGGLLYKLAPIYRFGFGPARVLLFKKLSQFAFAHHHDYWGYRFLGWGLHYIQDATQPYHSSIVPGTPTPAIIAVAALNAARITRPQQLKTFEVTNLHIAIEDFQFRLVSRDLEAHSTTSPYLAAIEGNGHDQPLAHTGANCSPTHFLTEAISLIAHGEGAALHKGLASFIPKSIIYSPSSPTTDMNFLKLEEAAPVQRRAAFEAEVLKLFGDVGRGTRQFVFDCN